MARDPAFLWYDGDAARDVSHMNRLERGAYFDIVQAQRKFRGITAEQARKILGSDFEAVWPSIEMILDRDETGKYIIPWVQESIDKRTKFNELQKNKIQNYWDKKHKKNNIPRNYPGNTVEIPLENEKENEKENNTRGECEGGFTEFWTLYPKKVGKGAAYAAWKKLPTKNENLKKIKSALLWQIKSEQWTRDNGQYIPNPSTYLNQKRWLDEPMKPYERLPISHGVVFPGYK